MKYLFDTDTVTTLLKPNPPSYLLERMHTVEAHEQHISTITVLEISYGAYRISSPQKYLDFLETEILPRVQMLSFDDTAAYMAGRIRAERESLGKPIAPLDLQIAAIAWANGCTLVTGNTRHFESIPQIEVQNWIRL